MEILFVCTGNICRSAMGEAILYKLLKEKGKNRDDIIVKSAGIYAAEGEPASDYAAEVVKDMGADLSCHASRRLKKEMIENADLVFAMTRAHKNHILHISPESEKKVFTLKEFVNVNNINKDGSLSENIDIDDPYGMGRDVYEKCASEIEDLLRKIIDIIF